jgi:hypothetical protein
MYHINHKLLESLPDDIIINNIIPYTYEKQPKQLLQDIRSYTADLDLIDNYYMFESNEIVLLNDLVRFCNNNIAPVYDVEPRYETILKRHFCIKDMSPLEIKQFVFFEFHRRLIVYPERKIKFLWGLLTPVERTRFFNRYVLPNDSFV